MMSLYTVFDQKMAHYDHTVRPKIRVLAVLQNLLLKRVSQSGSKIDSDTKNQRNKTKINPPVSINPYFLERIFPWKLTLCIPGTGLPKFSGTSATSRSYCPRATWIRFNLDSWKLASNTLINSDLQVAMLFDVASGTTQYRTCPSSKLLHVPPCLPISGSISLS